MTTYAISPNGNDSTGIGTPTRPWRSFGKAKLALKPGDFLEPVAGSYYDGPDFAANGTKEQPITVRGDGRAITKGARLMDRSNIIIDGLHIKASLGSWFTTNKASIANTLQNCQFSSDLSVTGGWPFVGGLLEGSWNTLKDCIVGDWVGGDAISVRGDYNLIEQVDFSKANNPHGSLTCLGSYNVIRGRDAAHPMKITNRWDRPLELYEMAGLGFCRRNLYENLEVTYSNWDGITPIAPGWTGGSPGAGQLMKIGGDGNILRDSSIRYSFAKGITAKLDYRPVFQIGNFMGGEGSTRLSANFRNGRYYRLNISDNPLHAIAVTINTALAHDYSNNKFFNSTFLRNLSFLWASQDGSWVDGVSFFHNQIDGAIRRGARTYTLAEYEQAFPKLAYGNTVSQAAPLAPLGRVTAAGASLTNLTLSDAWGISDGNQRKPGDLIQIGHQTARVSKWIDGNHVTLASPVTVEGGEAVYQASWGVVVQPPPVVVIPPPPPPPVPEVAINITTTQPVVLTVNGLRIPLV